MNEKIKQLATQAGGEFYEGFAGSPNAIKFSEDELVKFVEFLLDEAADEIREIDGNDYQTELFNAFDL
jgi:hypothetical protein